MYVKRVLGLDDARVAVDAVLRAAAETAGAPIVVAVTDADGELIAYARMDGAGHVSRSMAVRKAYTSAKVGLDSGAYGERMRDAGIDLALLGDPNLCGFAGAVCVRADGMVVGAIGVSGRTEEEDEELARAGERAIAGLP